MKTAKMKERMQTKLQQKKQQQQQQPEKQTPPVAVASNTVRPTTAVYTSVSGEQIQQTPRTARPTVETVVLDANVTTQQTAETVHEEGNSTQKKKKKKNKNKK